MRLRQRLTRYPRLYLALRRVAKIGRFLLRRPHEREFEMFGRWPGDGLFLDVGANAGQSAMSFRIFNRRARILSIEPNPALEPDLRIVRRLVGRCDYLMVGAGERLRTATLYIPDANGTPLSGEASFHAAYARRPWWDEEAELARGVSEVEVPVVPIDLLDLAPAYVKIDTEGYALPVLEGMDATIRRTHPVFLVEGGRDVVSFLARYGYTPHTYEGDGVLGPWNPAHSDVFLLPAGGARGVE